MWDMVSGDPQDPVLHSPAHRVAICWCVIIYTAIVILVLCGVYTCVMAFWHVLNYWPIQLAPNIAVDYFHLITELVS